MVEQKGSIIKRVLHFIKGHGFILFIGLVAGRILGEEQLSKLEMAEGIWFWIGSYFLGVFVLAVAFIINRSRQLVLGKGNEK